MGVGYDRLEREALAKRGVTVCNVPGETYSFRSHVPHGTPTGKPIQHTNTILTLDIFRLRYMRNSGPCDGTCIIPPAWYPAP